MGWFQKKYFKPFEAFIFIEHSLALPFLLFLLSSIRTRSSRRSTMPDPRVPPPPVAASFSSCSSTTTTTTNRTAALIRIRNRYFFNSSSLDLGGCTTHPPYNCTCIPCWERRWRTNRHSYILMWDFVWYLISADERPHKRYRRITTAPAASTAAATTKCRQCWRANGSSNTANSIERTWYHLYRYEVPSTYQGFFLEFKALRVSET